MAASRLMVAAARQPCADGHCIAIHSKFYTMSNAGGDTRAYEKTAWYETFGGWQ